MNQEELFHAALATPPDKRSEFLAAACSGDVALEQRLEALLQAHENPGSFLADHPSVPGAAVEDIVTERAGAVIGPYQLLQQLGEGGMGTVWMAQQTEPVKRVVALKLIKAGMDSKQIIARFEAERQVLALMEHSNIAKVLDAGATIAGRPYFVMDLVKGIPITRYCDEQHLTPRQRLELFIPVCQAVQHAHQKGIIHRDLKPSNLLVAVYDGKPVPKVIDFGVAKAAGQTLTEKTLVTGFGAIVGTLEYMSPEQAEINQLDIDTRSDIYSLGVLLYELLTATTPLTRQRLKESALLEVLRLVREEEPPKPSTRLSESKDTLPSISAQRQSEPAQLTRLVRGELDWIVMKALDKDRNRRYETAGAFAADLQRYLADEPVHACPPSAGYRLQKFVRRNQGPVAAAAVVLLTLVGGIVGTTWGLLCAEQALQAEADRAEGELRAKQEVQRRLAQVENGTQILASVFRDLDPMAAEQEGVTLRALLTRRMADAAQQLAGEAVGDPLVVARLQDVLGTSLYELGELKQAERVLAKACRTRERLLEAGHLDTASTQHHLAMVYRQQRKYGLAKALYRAALAVRTAKLGADHADTLATQHHLAILYHAQEKFDLAETLYKEVLAARTAGLGADHRDTLTTQHRLAWLYRGQRKYALAEELFKEVLAIRTAKLGPDHLDTAATKHNLAALYGLQGKSALAEPLCQEALAVRSAKLGADHLDTLTSRAYLASLYHDQGKLDLAEGLCKEVLEKRTAKLGPDDPLTLGSKDALATVYRDQGEFAQAEALYKETLALRTAKLGHDHADIINSQDRLAILYSKRFMNRPDLELPLLEQVFKLTKAKLPPDHPDLLHRQVSLGLLYFDAGRFADAEPPLIQGYEGMKKREAEISPRDKVHFTEALKRLVQLYEARDRPDEAARWRKELEKTKK